MYNIFILVKWFNDVHSTEISDKCEEALNLEISNMQLMKWEDFEAKKILIQLYSFPKFSFASNSPS